MDPKQQALRNKQRERQQRGSDFQEEYRRSWHEVPNVWQIRIKDGRGGTKPADHLTICQKVNILAELKRTASQKFELGYLEPNQIRGLIDFDQVIAKNYGLVICSFHNPGKGLDECYAIRLVTAIRYMNDKGRNHITLEELQKGALVGANIQVAIKVPRLEKATPTYDLKGVSECYKYL